MFIFVLGIYIGIFDLFDIILYIDIIMDNIGISILIIKKDINIFLFFGRG